MIHTLAPRRIIVDLFAGGGGASTAIFNATGRHPDVAVNHNPVALGVHAANHPDTRHLHCDVREVDPIEACTFDGQLHPVDLLWASPDCTHFSKARGGKPVEKGIRSLADVVLVWVAKLKEHGAHPRMIALENVEEFQDWGPVLENGKPCLESKGIDFRRWVKGLRDLGYAVEWNELVAANFGAPTTRKRLFLIARCDGERIRKPEQTHASRAHLNSGSLFESHLRPWKAAADIIDWSVPVPSIFGRKRPLKPKTCARIAKGIKRYVIDAPKPFIVPVTHSNGWNSTRSAEEPIPTMTTAKGGEFAVAAPVLAGTAYGDDRARAGLRAWPVDGPARTITGSNDTALASAMLVPRYGEREGQEPRARDIQDAYPTVVPGGNGGDLTQMVLGGASVGVGGRAGQSPPRGLTDPVHTVTAKADRAIAGAFLQKMAQNGQGTPLEEPLDTAMAGATKHYEVAAHLTQFNGRSVGGLTSNPLPTAVSRDRHGVVAASMVQSNGNRVGREVAEPVTTLTGRSTQQSVMAATLDGYYRTGTAAHPDEPIKTITDRMRHSVNAAYMEQANTGLVGHPVTDPVSTIMGKGCTQRLIQVGMIPANDKDGASPRAQVVAFLWEHFEAPTEAEWAAPAATAASRLKFGLVVIDGIVWQIVDIGMRMLTPRELFNAQGFPPDYIIDRTADGKPVTKTAQTSAAGNSVSPPPAEALLRANLTWMALPERAAA